MRKTFKWVNAVLFGANLVEYIIWQHTFNLFAAVLCLLAVILSVE